MEPQNLFKEKLRVPLNTVILSDAVQFQTAGIIYAVSSDVKLYKNSVEFSSPLSFLSSDIIQLSITSSSEYADAVFGVVSVELSSGETSTHIFACVTKSNYKKVEEFADLEPFSLTTYADGSNYVPNSASNKVLIFENIEDSEPDKTITNLYEPVSVGNPDNLDSIVICSYFNNKIHKINVETEEIYSNIDVPGRPYGAIAVPISTGEDYVTNLWVTIANQNRILVIDNDDEIIGEYPTGERPLGIAIDSFLENVWVANNGDNTVTRFSWDYVNKLWNSTIINVGNKPYEIACDIYNNAWVTCAGDNRVYRITLQNTVTYYEVGENPRGIAYSNEKMWVAISYEERIVSLDLNGNIVNIIEDVGLHPFSVGAISIPTSLRGKLSEIINILDELRYDSLYDSLTLLERINTDSVSDIVTLSDSLREGDKLSDSVSLTDSLSRNAISDSLSITESLSAVLTTGEPPADTTKDALYNYVVLHVNGEAPTR